MGWRFVDPEKVLLGISGWGEETSEDGGKLEGKREKERMLVIAGEEDRIMTQDIMQRLANWYRAAYERLVMGKKIDGLDVVRRNVMGEDVMMMDDTTVVAGHEEGDGKDMGDHSSNMGVMYAVVPGAGHHCQNDAGWEVGARKVLEFYRGLL